MNRIKLEMARMEFIAITELCRDIPCCDGKFPFRTISAHNHSHLIYIIFVNAGEIYAKTLSPAAINIGKPCAQTEQQLFMNSLAMQSC